MVAPTLDHDDLERLRDLVEEAFDATLEGLEQEMKASGSIRITSRAMQGPGHHPWRSPCGPR